MDSDTLVRRVREEFREMPGLRLTVAQVSRLWGPELSAPHDREQTECR